MDKVILKDFEVKACHGVNEEEKINPQRFLFTAVMYLDFSDCAKNDDLTQTVSYSAVKKTLKSFCENNSFDLIETLAVRSATLLLKTYPLLQRVELTVKKPDAPMSGVFDCVATSVERGWHEVYLALGSSIGDGNAHLDFAINKLRADDCFKEINESARIVSKPYGGVATGDFTNSVVRVKTLYSPKELLEKVMQIESEGGRVRDKHWGDRTLDIDILFYDDLICEDDDLCIPHPDMQNRDFVLAPLMQLCPNKVHPLLNRRIRDMQI